MLKIFLTGIIWLLMQSVVLSGTSLRYWVVNESRKVHPGEKIKPEEWLFDAGTRTVLLFGAKNETVSFQIILRSKNRTKVANASFSWQKPSPLKGTFFWEGYLFAPEVPKKIVAGPKGEYPDPLVPFWDPYRKGRSVALPFTLTPGRNQPIWVDIKIPAGCPAGIHKGFIRFETDTKETIKIYLRLQVWNFVLPDKINLTAWVPLYWERLARAERLNPKSLFLPQNWPVILRYYQMAHDHDFVTQIANGVDQPKIVWDETTGKMKFIDWKTYDFYFGPILSGVAFSDGNPPALWKVGGWIYWGAREGDRPYFGDDYRTSAVLSPAHRAALRAYAGEIDRHFAEKGWRTPERFMYMIDEPDLKSYPNLASFIHDLGKTIHEGSSRIKHLVTAGPQASPALIGGVDIWATTGGTYWVPEMKKRQALGEKAWFYQDHEPFVGGNCLNQDGLSLRTWPWIAKRYGVNGIFLWVGDFWPKDVYQNALNWNRLYISNGILFYPGHQLPQINFPPIDGPVSSFRMKELRRGMQDYAYFQLAGKKAGVVVKGIIHSALNPEEADPYWKDPRWAKPGNWSHNPKDWEFARRKLAEIILKKTIH
ncbi:hypothetical protein BMS3Bbin03_01605 [bacterium BMS3Bbin03]|nr:hypothetical protein BMS3Bbin03_01605 [bacterium BMS3Bbin03]